MLGGIIAVIGAVLAGQGGFLNAVKEMAQILTTANNVEMTVPVLIAFSSLIA